MTQFNHFSFQLSNLSSTELSHFSFEVKKELEQENNRRKNIIISFLQQLENKKDMYNICAYLESIPKKKEEKREEIALYLLIYLRQIETIADEINLEICLLLADWFSNKQINKQLRKCR